MSFEEPVPRVRYHLNPLVEVVCEVQFSEQPLSNEELDGLLAALASNYPDRSDHAHYIMARAEPAWTLSVWHDFIALTTQRYTSWEALRSRFAAVLALLPASAQEHLTLVSVKYVDVIIPQRLNLDAPWRALLRSELVGLLDADPACALEGAVSSALFQLSDQDMLRLHYGLASHDDTHERGFLLDTLIFHDHELTSAAALQKLDKFNLCARNVFRWATTDMLRQALVPEPLEG